MIHSHNIGALKSSHQSTLLAIAIILFLMTGCATSKLGRSGQQKIAGKTYVIVGASSGIGRGVAEQLGAYHANVVLAARRTDLLEEVAANIRAAGGTAVVVTMDISKAEDLLRVADTAVSRYGDIDVWVNMAGIGGYGYFWDIPMEDQARVVDVNLKGFIYGSHVALRRFIKQGHGTLVNMGSGESFIPIAYHTTYATTKAGILSLGLSLNQELRLSGHRNIKVVTIEPWASDTPYFTHTANYSGSTPRMVAMDPPRKVVNAVIRSSIRPRKEVAVGGKSKASKVAHWLVPHFVERMAANITRNEIRKAPPAPSTSGSIYKPMKEGRDVNGGVRERMKRENRECTKHKKHTK